MNNETQIDVEVQNEGTIFLFRPLTDAAKDWIEENVSDTALTFGNAVVVEHRYASDIVHGMQGDGLVLA